MANDRNKEWIRSLKEGKPEDLERYRLNGEDSRKVTYSFAELIQERGKVQPFLLPELLPKATVTILMGADGVGKSQILAQLCLSVCLKHEVFCGVRLENITSGKALFVGTEDAKQKFGYAVTTQAYTMEPNLDPKQIGLFFTEASMFDDFEELKAEVSYLIEEHKFDVIVIDVLSDMFLLSNSDINDSGAARRILSFFQMIADKTGAAVIVIHHASKTSMKDKKFTGRMFLQKDDSQGAGAITQKARTVLALTHDNATADGEKKTYRNYLHAVKGNLMGRNYVLNAIELEFSEETLLHRFVAFIDIWEREQQNKTALGIVEKLEEPKKQGMTKVKRAAYPHEITDADHYKLMKEVFRDNMPLTREETVKRMTTIYDVGKNKIEQSGGFMSYLQDKGWLVRTGAVFTFNTMAYNPIGDDDEPPF